MASYYEKYKTKVIIEHNGNLFTLSALDGFEIDYSLQSNKSSDPATSTVTIYNLSKEHANLIHKDDHIKVYTGPESLYCLYQEGKITLVNADQPTGQDRATTITFTEGLDYSKDKRLYSNFNGSKKVTKTVSESDGTKITYSKLVKKKLNITFKKGITAKKILKRISRDAKIPLDIVSLKRNHKFKKGYTLSQKPEAAIEALAKDCKSELFRRRGKLCIISGDDTNPFKEHIYFKRSGALIADPVLNDGDSRNATYTLTCMIDPRVVGGSSVWIENFKTLKTVTAVTLTKDDSSYTMEVTVDA